MDAPVTLPGDPQVTIRLRRSARARRLSLRVSRLDGRVTLTLPLRTPRREAIAFAREKAEWVRAHLAQQRPKVVATLGATIPVEGQLLQIVEGRRTGLEPAQNRIAVSPRCRSVPAAVGGVLKAAARDRLTAASDRYAAALSRAYTRISLRDTRSRWGSCTSSGALMYSWRLILAPPEVLDYVAAHEVAHLAEMNHGPNFWAAVATLCPDFAAHRLWLRHNGEELHRYRFVESARD